MAVMLVSLTKEVKIKILSYEDTNMAVMTLSANALQIFMYDSHKHMTILLKYVADSHKT